MKICKHFALLAFLTLFAVGQEFAAANGNGNGNGKGNSNGKNDSVEFIFSSVPALELPGKAVQLIDEAKPKDRESVALQIIRYVADARQASVVPVVSSLTARLGNSRRHHPGQPTQRPSRSRARSFSGTRYERAPLRSSLIIAPSPDGRTANPEAIKALPF